MMDSAAAQMQAELQQVTVSAPVTPLYANYTAEHYAQDAAAIKQNIAMQVNHPVPWQAILKKMADEGVTDFVEVGPGKTLAGLVKKTLPGVSIHRVEDAETLQATVDALK
ncbi:MAG: ACP S-malonyltransferase [Anaeromassilibacillus sp.]